MGSITLFSSTKAIYKATRQNTGEQRVGEPSRKDFNTVQTTVERENWAIEEQAKELGWAAIHDQLAKVDPASAARLEKNDAQRVQRALEIYLQSGKPMSEWLNEQPKDTGRGDGDIPLNFRLS